MVYQETWSLGENRIRQYFENTYQVPFPEQTVVIGRVTVRIEVLPPNMIMKVPIPRTLVEISGPNPEVENIHRNFVLNFLSAGG